MPEITIDHLRQMRHAVGFFERRPGYRNMYNTGSETSEIWEYLKEIGLAGGGNERLGSISYWLTDEGKEFIGLPEQIRMMEQVSEDREEAYKRFCEHHDVVPD